MGAEAAVLEFLEREAALARELEAVLNAERDAVTGYRAQDIDRCVRRKISLHRELISLADARRRAVSELGDSVGATVEEGRLLPLLPHLPRATAQVLGDARVSLRDTLLRTRRMQRVNAAIIGSSLSFVKQIVDALKELLPGARYDEKATLRPGADASSLNRRA